VKGIGFEGKILWFPETHVRYKMCTYWYVTV